MASRHLKTRIAKIVRKAPSATATLLAQLATFDSSDWSQAQEASILKHFKDAVRNVPAYRKFLDFMGIESDDIRSVKDLQNIPPISKSNYLRVHPWKNLSTVGAFSHEALVLTSTSGSTGQPFYIPRTNEVHAQSMLYHRLFIDRSGLDPKKPTLVVVCFGMGVWIGGLLTYEAFRRISEDGRPLTIVTPGVNKKEIFEALTHIAPAYDQLVLCGYPPFVKDIVDDGSHNGIDWKKWDIRIVCAAEAFSEHFRDYLIQKIGAKDPYRSVMNIYGSAELGTMATETPLAILVRRLALKNDTFYRKLFKEAHRLPTLAQFIPSFVAFEESEDGRIYATDGTVLPFIKYDIGDHGGVRTFAEVEQAAKDSGINLSAEVKHAGIAETVHHIPFVYVFERSDLSTKLYGAIIYSEHVKIGLQKSELEKSVTGRFTITTEHDAQHNEYLEINVELQAHQEPTDELKQKIIVAVMESLARNSAEYSYLVGTIHDKIVPRIVFWPHGHPQYFRPDIKQKWVIRSKELS